MRILLAGAALALALPLAGCFTPQDCATVGVLAGAGAAVTGDLAGRNDAKNAQTIATVATDACPGVVAAGELAGRLAAARAP